MAQQIPTLMLPSLCEGEKETLTTNLAGILSEVSQLLEPVMCTYPVTHFGPFEVSEPVHYFSLSICSC